MSDAGLENQLPSSHWKRFGRDAGRSVRPVAIHAIATMAAIFFMYLTEQLLILTMGHEAKFFDTIPVSHVIHASDVAIFVRFAINVWRELR
jgi:hypothetical protein